MDRNDTLLAYTQNRLSKKERNAFEQEIAGDANLAAEVTALRSAKTAMMPQDVPDKSAGWNRLSTAIDQETFQPANQNRPIRLSLIQTAASVVVAVFLWQSFAAPYLQKGDFYSTVSETHDAPILQIIFSDGATLVDVSDLLSDLQASIVSGPSALGIYRVEFASQDSLMSAKETLTARSDLIERVLVE